jgi:hypothetical protein
MDTFARVLLTEIAASIAGPLFPHIGPRTDGSTVAIHTLTAHYTYEATSLGKEERAVAIHTLTARRT